ncbi:MAG: CBS domain-containing protein [Candidatus Woesearchaeota archaeon]|nr:CBS domain-containing protein [Candidatus Woesearchaeota archaeon]
MPHELEEIRLLRKKLGITQSDLAKLANVSQSFIAKLEARLIEPSYTKTKKLFEVLTSFKEEKDPKAEQLMIKKIISLKPNDKVDEAIKLMRKHAISQVPIVERNNVVGIVSEATIINNIGKDIASLELKDIMEETPPIISKNSSMGLVSDLLKHYPIILVADKGKLEGLITKADLLKKV